MSVITDNYTIDLGDNSNLSLTKSIYDIQEPDKRKSNFTKTITIPSSTANDLVFASWFDVNFYLSNDLQQQPFFNPNKKAPCILHTSELEQMTGYAQMTAITLNQGKWEYEVTLYGELRDLFAIITNKKLSDLDLSEFNHPYNETSIVNSWTAPTGAGYVYPMIDYGDNHDHWVNGVNTSNVFWITEHFKPFIYVKTIIDKIFADSGYNYSSSFFNSALFKKLIYQGDIAGLIKTNQEIEDYSVVATNTTTQTFTNLGDDRTPANIYSNYKILYDTIDLDTNTQYNPATGTTTILQGDYYNFYGEFRIKLTNTSVINLADNLSFALCVIDSTGTILSTKKVKLNLLEMFPLGGVFNAGTSYTFKAIHQDFLRLDAGQQVRVCLRALSTNYVKPYISIEVTNIENSFSFTPWASTLYGTDVKVSQMLDDKMSQKDFLMNIVKMFNLYIEPYHFREGDVNSGKYNEYLIETRDEYFTDDVIDWTANLDLSKEFTIKPAFTENKYFKFTYASDNDYLQERYKAQTNRIFGDYIHQIDNDFVKETKKIEIQFAQTLITDTSLTNFKTPMPTIKMDNSYGDTRKDGKPRILFYNGLQNCADWSLNGTRKQQYPLATNYDDWTNPTCDLNFGQPSVVYYNGVNGELTFTNGTLFNRYYYRQITETTDRNSKIIECYMRLRPSDIHNVSFRPLYFINNAYYRLYEIIDHNYEQTTLCRFLKINEASPITNSLVKTRGARITTTGTKDKTPYKDGSNQSNPIKNGYGLWKTGGGVVIADGVLTNGFTKGIAGSNVLQGGLATSEIVRDNIIDLGFNYLNSVTSNYTITGMEGSPLYIIVDTSAGNVTITLPEEVANDGKVYYIYKSVVAHKVIVNKHDATLKKEINGKVGHKFMLIDGDVFELI
jgi:hypothetical protein